MQTLVGQLSLAAAQLGCGQLLREQGLAVSVEEAGEEGEGGFCAV